MTASPSFEIQGRTVDFPVEVRDASGAIASFVVPSNRARSLVGDAFDVAEFFPGRTLLFLGCIDYRDNDLGDYNEVAMNFFVRQKGEPVGLPYLGAWQGIGRGTLASYSYKMPVNQSFTRDAGATIWGFPKTIERIDFDYGVEGRFRGLLEMDGERVFDIDLPRGGSQDRPPASQVAYSYIHGIPHQTRFTQESRGMAVKFRDASARLELGPHPIADVLRELGLPKRPLMTTWVERMVMSFGAAEKL